jgi:hypothetical protein
MRNLTRCILSLAALLFLAQTSLAATMSKTSVTTNGASRPKVNCKDGLETLSVGSENILTRETWEKFKKKYPMFVLGVADSS